MKILEGREQDYKDWFDKNTDPYGRGCFTYAERWAEMLENLIESSADEPMKVVVDNAYRLKTDIESAFYLEKRRENSNEDFRRKRTGL